MEDALVHDDQAAFAVNHIVLILVLMEDALVHYIRASFEEIKTTVLILVLMEDALVPVT